jgi:hypothetical protein
MDGGFNSFADYSAAVLLGRVPGVTRVAGLSTRTLGVAITGIDTAEDVWAGAANTYPWMLADTALEAVSDNANDTAAGTGAQSINVQGVLSAGTATNSGNIPLNGLTPVSVGTHYRINLANAGMVAPVAGTQTNLGTITIRDAGGGTVRAVIPPRARSAQQCVYTPPLGFFLVVRAVEIELLAAAGGASRHIDAGLYFRFTNSISGTPRQIQCSDGQPYALDAHTSIPVGPMTDFCMRVVFSSTNTIKVGAAFEGHLYKI